MSKWTSNCQTVFAIVPLEDRSKEEKELDLNKEQLTMEQAFGLQWCLQSDAKFNINISEQAHTRSGILYMVRSVHNPLGLSVSNHLARYCNCRNCVDRALDGIS